MKHTVAAVTGRGYTGMFSLYTDVTYPNLSVACCTHHPICHDGAVYAWYAVVFIPPTWYIYHLVIYPAETVSTHTHGTAIHWQF